MQFKNLHLLNDGAMQLEFTAAEMKSDRAFEPALLHGRELSDPHAVAMVHPDLWTLYLMKDGARDEILRLIADSDVTVRERDRVVDTRQTNPWQPGAASEWRFVPEDDHSAPEDDERDRRLSAGDVAPSNFVFPTMARRGGGHGTRQSDRLRSGLPFDEDSFTQQWKKRMREYAPTANVDVDELAGYFGGLLIF